MGIVCQLTIVSQWFLVDFPIPTGENNKATCVVHCLLIMQVGKFSTFVSSLPKRLKYFRANIKWKHIIAMKVLSSPNRIWIMNSLHQEIPRRIAMNKSNHTHLAALVHNTRIALSSKTSRQLLVGQEQVCYMLIFIGLHMPNKAAAYYHQLCCLDIQSIALVRY